MRNPNRIVSPEYELMGIGYNVTANYFVLSHVSFWVNAEREVLDFSQWVWSGDGTHWKWTWDMRMGRGRERGQGHNTYRPNGP